MLPKVGGDTNDGKEIMNV